MTARGSILFKISSNLNIIIIMPQYIIYTTVKIYYASALFFPAVLKKQLGISNPYFTLFIGFLVPGILLMAIIEWARVIRLNFILQSFEHRFLLASCICTDCCYNTCIHDSCYFSLVLIIIPLLYTYISETYPTAVCSFALTFFLLSAVGGIPFVSGYLFSLLYH